MTQAQGGLKSFKPIRKPIKMLLRVSISMFCLFLQSTKRTPTFTFDISTILVPNHKEKSLGGRSWYFQDLLWLWSYLPWLESIEEHPDKSYVVLLFQFMIFLVSILVFEYLIFCCDRFREFRIDFHAPYEIQAMGTEWFGVPNINIVL